VAVNADSHDGDTGNSAVNPSGKNWRPAKAEDTKSESMSSRLEYEGHIVKERQRRINENRLNERQ
jgi:hypothetical protein